MPGLVIGYAVTLAVSTLLTLSSRGLLADAEAATSEAELIDAFRQALLVEARG